MPRGFEDFEDIYPFIRNRMPDSLLEVPDDTLDPEIGSVLRRLLDRFPCILSTYTSYDRIDAADKAWLDEAIGLIVAYRLLTPMTTGGSNSDLVLEKTATQTRQYAQISNTTQGEKDRWLREAAEALGRVACVKAYFQKSADAFSPFLVSGPTRSALAAGSGQTLLGVILRAFGEPTNTLSESPA